MISFFKKKFSSEELEFINLVKFSPLFEGFSDEELIETKPAFHLRTYNNGEQIYYEGDQGLSFYHIKTGNVKIYTDINSHSEVIQNAQKGDTFGENALIENTTRLFNAVAEQESSIFVVPVEKLRAEISKKGALERKLLINLSRVFYKFQSDLVSTYQKDFSFFELKNIYS